MRKVGRAVFGAAMAAFVVLGTASVPASASQGAPDKTFGSGGKQLTPGGASTGYYEDVALQADGKIVAFGVRGNTKNDAVFTRYTTTGAVDSTFGTNGTVELWIGPADIDELPIALLQQPDGKLVGVVSFSNNNVETTGLVRLNADGTVDGTFGLFGRAWYGPATSFIARGANLLADGRFAFAGTGASSTSPGDFKLAMAVLGSNGAPDAGFGTGGVAVSELAPNFSEGMNVVQTDTGFVVGGDRVIQPSGGDDFVVAGFTATGGHDASVGVRIVDLGVDDAVWDVALQNDGKFILAGDGLDISGDHQRTDLARFTPDGNLDATFGLGGKVTTPFDTGGAYSVAVQTDGKVVVAGTEHDTFVVKRFLSNGTPDVTFGCLGTTEADFGGYDAAYEVALQPDGRILAVGSAYGRNGADVEDFALARFERDGGPGACGYELDGQGGLHRFGIGNPATPPAAGGATFWSGKDVARGVAVSPNAGGVVVDITGALHPFAIPGVTGKPVVGSPGAMPAPNLARGVAMLPNGKGGYVLDGWGGMHPFAIGNNPKPPAVASPSWTNWNIARGVTILPDGTGGYIIDAWGGLHPFAIGNNARPPAASGGYWKGWDIARGVTVLADGTGGYVLDGWGGMHAFAIGNNPRPPAATAGYWRGWDIARGVAALP